MEEIALEAGEVLFSQGDPSDQVFVVLDGRLEVLRNHGDQPVLLGVATSGQMLGEMGVIRDKPRSATVRAVDAAKLTRIAKDDFLKALDPENALGLSLVRLLCERLGNANSRIDDLELKGLGAKTADVKAIRLLPGSDAMATQIDPDGVTIESLPFRIGRGGTPNNGSVDLCLAGHETSQMSPEHFAIEDIFGDLVIHDLGSELGTSVNGRRLASFEERLAEKLHFGNNEVQAGGADSSVRFTIEVT